MTIPPGFVRVDVGGAKLLARADARDALERAVLDHGTLERWAARSARRRLGGGRGGVHVVEARPGSARSEAWVVRHYRRGGAVARLLEDRYARAGGPARPFAEVSVLAAAGARGVPVPGPVAGAVYEAGPFYRADLVTAEVPGTVDLAALLFEAGRHGGAGTDGLVPREDALHAAGRLIRCAAAAGLEHADLNAGNVLLRGGEVGPEAWLVDLDRCRILPAGRSASAARMLARLERSLAKLGRAHGRSLAAGELAALRAGAEEGAVPGGIDG